MTINLIIDSIKSNPNDSTLWAKLANHFMLSGEIKKAKNIIKKGIKINPKKANFHFFLGNILILEKKFLEAEVSTRKAIEYKSDFALAHYNLGIILKELGRLQEAEMSILEAIKLKSGFANAYYNLGVIAKDLGKLKEAEVYTRKAIEINPEFAMAYDNLASILIDLGQLKEAEIYRCKALEKQPNNEILKCNLIKLLTIYKPINHGLNPFFKINEEFKQISLPYIENRFIDDNYITEFYSEGSAIYDKYNLKIQTSLSQIYKRNELVRNCKRHKLIFEQNKIIPEFCFSCYKVQVKVNSIIELLKLFIVFSEINLINNNSRKCFIELRPNIKGFYKGLIYCLGLEEANEVSAKVDHQIKQKINLKLKSKIKRGCSEYPLAFPKYKEISNCKSKRMNYNEEWRSIENETDRVQKYWGKGQNSINGFNLNNFLILRNWIAYAQKIGDRSVNKITSENIEFSKYFNISNKVFEN